MKMADRVRARKKVKDAPTILDLQQFLAEELDDGDDDDAFTLTHGKSVCNVTIGNPDLPRIVNGFPGDPIQKRPFDFVFTKENIWGWWKKVGFMPMSRNSLNHPKVRWELGEGGAPEEATVRLELLVDDYNERARMLNANGFNGDILDLEPRRVEENTEIGADEEAQIQQILKNKAVNAAGGLFKAGIIVANGRVILEAAKRQRENTTKADGAKVQKKKDDTEDEQMKAIEIYRKWLTNGKKTDGNGYPELSKSDSKIILNVLLLRIDPAAGRSKYDSMVKCRKWLGELKGGTTWDTEMEQVKDAYASVLLQNTPRLF